MIATNPAALSYLFQDDLYLLPTEPIKIETIAAGDTIPPNVEQPLIETTASAFNCLGVKDSGFLIVVNYLGEEFMDAGDLSSLEGILKAKKMSLSDVTIFNIANFSDAGFDAVTAYFKPEKLLLFGVEIKPKSFNLNTLTELDEIKVLSTESFSAMADNKDKKLAFWNQMKTF